MKSHRIDINGRALFVAFRSSFQGVSDYTVSHRAEPETRVRVRWLDTDAHQFELIDETNPEKAERFVREYGFPWVDACAAVRQAIHEQFDADTRAIVARGLLEYSTPAVRARAESLGLICPASLQS